MRTIVAQVYVKKENKILMVQENKVGKKGKWNMPAGKLDNNESVIEAAIRETKEETCCDIELVKPLMVEDYGEGICHWYLGKYISGTPTLGGEEKERNNPNNSFEVVLVPFDEIDNVNILGEGKNLIKKCIKEKDL